MSGDVELDAMSAVVAAVAPLDADAQRRVIKWAAERYGVAATMTPTPPAANGKSSKPPKPAKKSAAASQPEPETLEPIDEEAVVAAIADATDVSAEKLRRLFHADDGVIKILAKPPTLGAKEAEKARTVAQLLTVINKVGLGKDTPFGLIRAECERKHCYSTKHFGNYHMPNIPGFAVKGSGASKRMEARHDGLLAFPALVDKVLGES